MNTPWIGAIVVLLALVLTRLSGALDKKADLKALMTQTA
jgi:DHA1 family inner membrane transport protein